MPGFRWADNGDDSSFAHDRVPRRKPVFRHGVRLCLMGVLAATWVGCERPSSKVAPPGPPTIPVAKPAKGMTTEYVEYTGRTNAKDYITIVPRVTGYLNKLPFKEGAEVKKDELLFEIDDRPYKAQLKAAKAVVATSTASLKYAKATNLRYKDLAEKQPGAVSKRELDQYQALEEQAKANLDLAEANLAAAAFRCAGNSTIRDRKAAPTYLAPVWSCGFGYRSGSRKSRCR